MKPLTATVNWPLTSALAGAALLTFIGAGSAGAQVMLRVPDQSPGIPAYAHVERQFVWHTEQLAAIVFLRAPDCVPANFNLLDLYDLPAPPVHPGAFACPLTTSGFELWDDPGKDGAPRQAVSTGNAVPVWFVSWPVLQAALADNVLTKSELESLNPLKGVATSFHELLHPDSGPPGSTGGGNGRLTITASGFLRDGRAFQYEFTCEFGKSANHVRIVIR